MHSRNPENKNSNYPKGSLNHFFFFDKLVFACSVCGNSNFCVRELQPVLAGTVLERVHFKSLTRKGSFCFPVGIQMGVVHMWGFIDSFRFFIFAPAEWHNNSIIQT